jgi:hypothetical protein
VKRLACMAAALLGACATTGSSQPRAEWLVGTWLMLAPDLEFPTACASGLPISYQRDGTYRLFEEHGTWRLEGDRLTETATGATEDVIDPAEVQIGVPFVSRIDWQGRDTFRKTYADGSVETFRRCPPP